MIRRPRAVHHGGALLVALALASGAPDAQRPEASAAAPHLRFELAPERSDRMRVEAAARAAGDQYRLSLGSPPDELVIAGPAAPAAQISLDLPWLSAAETMEIEAHVVFAVGQHWWPGWRGDPRARPVVDGLAWYLQSRVVPTLFDRAFHRPGYQAAAMRVFGGAVPWAFPLLTLGPETAGLGMAEFLRGDHAGAWPALGRRLPAGADPLTPRVALAFATIERLVGWPALEGALAVLGESASVRAMPPEEIAQVLSSATGYPLEWFLAAAIDRERTFDYQLGSVVTASCGTTCVRTDVTVHNRGNAVFAGPGIPSPASYQDSGPLELRAVFADGQAITTRWDGRGASRVFSFESAAPAASVELDPNRVLMLDRSRLDDRWQASPPAGALTAKWTAWWLLWLQDASLSYGALF